MTEEEHIITISGSEIYCRKLTLIYSSFLIDLGISYKMTPLVKNIYQHNFYERTYTFKMDDETHYNMNKYVLEEYTYFSLHYIRRGKAFIRIHY